MSVTALARPASSRTALLRSVRPQSARTPPGATDWLVDVGALARCRAVLTGSEASIGAAPTHYAALDVPAAYDQFCRSHFTSVRRLHPELEWHEACFAYALALSAHALLCDALDDERERRLAAAWPGLRGESRMDWAQARALVADGCSALARLDPLAMRR